ncbi:vWA domain-containing protein [Spirosoma arboris]|nr:VWA-like domain-containing protein [Spirosoma arboris]
MNPTITASELAKQALHVVRITIPYLAELTLNIELVPTNQVATAAIFASGRLIYNPDWLVQLSLHDASFVMAHEMMHLALRSHYRSSQEDAKLFNITHDYLINDILKRAFGVDEVPASGLDWDQDAGRYYSLADKPAEELLTFIRDSFSDWRLQQLMSRPHWQAGNGALATRNESPFADLLEKLNMVQPVASLEDRLSNKTDILSEELEQLLFPTVTPATIHNRMVQINGLVQKALAEKFVYDKLPNLDVPGWSQSNIYEVNYQAVKSAYKPPWEMALQQWLEFTARSGRTYTRPSRRGTYTDLVQAGYKREGNTIHIIIDTSGSMSSLLSEVLGFIASFAESSMIPEVHVVQCDTGVSDDSWYTPSELLDFQVKGLGGSDITPAMLHLAQDEGILYVVIITDGCIEYPYESMPYQVLWVLTDPYEWFTPPYGQVLRIE